MFSFGARGSSRSAAAFDVRGNNFWGVEFDGDQDVIAAADRDFGLYLLRYTGG